MITTTVVSSGIAIVLAKLGLKYYALATQSIIQVMVNFIWNYSSTRIKLRIKCNFGSVKKIFRFRHISLHLTCLIILQEMPIICL